MGHRCDVVHDDACRHEKTPAPAEWLLAREDPSTS